MYEYEVITNNQTHDSQSVLVVQVHKIHLGYLLKMQISRSHPRPSESESLGLSIESLH